MSNTPRAGTGSPEHSVDLSYEHALKKLEELVEALESGELPLESLLAKFEEGTRLVRHCQSKLADAELKIEQLEKSASGDLELKPFDTPPETHP